MNLGESEESGLEENSLWQCLRIGMERRLEHYELERDSLRTQLIFRLNLDTVHFFLSILAAYLRGRVPQDVAVSHSNQLDLVLV